MATMFKERFTRNPMQVFADASGLGEDMLEPDTESMERREDMHRLALGQDPTASDVVAAPDKPKIQIGPLFGIMAALLLLGLLVAGGERTPPPQLSSGRRFR